MDKLERAFEKLKKGYSPDKIASRLKLSEEERQLVEIAARLLKEPEISFTTEEKKILYASIASRIMPAKIEFPLKKRLVLALTTLLLLGSSVVSLAAASAYPESPLYPLKRVYYALSVRISLKSFKATEAVKRETLKKEIRDYELALKKHKKETNHERLIILKRALQQKQREYRKLVRQEERKSNEEKQSITTPSGPAQMKMPPLREPPKKRTNITEIPKLDTDYKNDASSTPENGKQKEEIRKDFRKKF